MLGGSPQSCGVLRTCCRVVPDAQHAQAALHQQHQQPFNLPQGSEIYQQFPGQHPQQPQHQPFPGHPQQPFQMQPLPHGIGNLPFLRPPFRKQSMIPGLPGSFEITGMSLFKPKLPFQRPPPHGPFVTPLPQFLGNNFQPSKPFQKPQHHGLPHFAQLPHGLRPVNPVAPLHLRPPQGRPLQIPISHQPYPSGSIVSPSNHLTAIRPSYGTCGARNAVGIHGRVQNLNYHESSTEFGECSNYLSNEQT